MYRDAQMHDRPVLMGDPRNKKCKNKTDTPGETLLFTAQLLTNTRTHWTGVYIYVCYCYRQLLSTKFKVGKENETPEIVTLD